MSWLAKNNPCVPFLSFCKSGSGRLVVLWKRPHEWSTSFAHTVSLPNPGSPTHPGLGKLCDQAQKQVDDLFSFWINVASPHGWLEKSSRRLMMRAPDPLTPIPQLCWCKSNLHDSLLSRTCAITSSWRTSSVACHYVDTDEKQAISLHVHDTMAFGIIITNTIFFRLIKIHQESRLPPPLKCHNCVKWQPSFTFVTLT